MGENTKYFLKCNDITGWFLPNFTVPNLGNVQIFQKPRNHFKILGARRVTLSNYHTEGPQILGAAIQNSDPWAPCSPGFVHPCLTSQNNFGIFWHLKCRCVSVADVAETRFWRFAAFTPYEVPAVLVG
jgi:hypothetical protein